MKNGSNYRCTCGQINLVVLALVVIVSLTLTQQRIEREGLVELLSFQLTTTTATDSTDAAFSSPSTHRLRQQSRMQPKHQLQQRSIQRIPQYRHSKYSTKYSPVSCHELFALDARDKQRGVTDPNEGILHARRTKDPPHFWMSLHQHDYDKTRWAIMEYGFYYERQQTRAFLQILKQPLRTTRSTATTSSSSSSSLPPLHVVDVGGNIGWYSMFSVAAALSSNRSIVIDVFEPNPRNRYRMCESLQINQWMDHEQVDFHIYPLGVSSSSGGSVRMSISESGLGKLGLVSILNETENIDIPLVALDDISKELGWEELNGDNSGPIAILKVDVEGLELEVFQGAQRLLQSGRVENIFFEGNGRDLEESIKFRSLIKILVQSGYHAYKHGSWMGPHKLILTIPIPQQQALEQEDLIVTYTEGVLAECSGNNPVQVTTPAGQKAENAQCNLWWRKSPNVASTR